MLLCGPLLMWTQLFSQWQLNQVHQFQPHLDSQFFIYKCFSENQKLIGKRFFKTNILLGLSLQWVVMVTKYRYALWNYMTCIRTTHNATCNSNMSFSVHIKPLLISIKASRRLTQTGKGSADWFNTSGMFHARTILLFSRFLAHNAAHWKPKRS